MIRHEHRRYTCPGENPISQGPRRVSIGPGGQPADLRAMSGRPATRRTIHANGPANARMGPRTGSLSQQVEARSAGVRPGEEFGDATRRLTSVRLLTDVASIATRSTRWTSHTRWFDAFRAFGASQTRRHSDKRRNSAGRRPPRPCEEAAQRTPVADSPRLRRCEQRPAPPRARRRTCGGAVGRRLPRRTRRSCCGAAPRRAGLGGRDRGILRNAAIARTARGRVPDRGNPEHSTGVGH